MAVALRKTLLASLDDLLAVVREFLNPNVSGLGLDRCLRRHSLLKWFCFSGQVCGWSKMHQVGFHAAFRLFVWVKYAVSGVRLSTTV